MRLRFRLSTLCVCCGVVAIWMALNLQFRISNRDIGGGNLINAASCGWPFTVYDVSPPPATPLEIWDFCPNSKEGNFNLLLNLICLILSVMSVGIVMEKLILRNLNSSLNLKTPE